MPTLSLGQGLNKITAIGNVTILDSDAQALINKVETTDGLALEAAVKNAIDNFVVGAKDDNIWTTLNSGVWRLLAGPRTLSGALVLGNGPDPSNFGFVAGDYNRDTGLQGNQSNYLDSNFSLNDSFQFDLFAGVYVSDIQSTTPAIALYGNGLVQPGTLSCGFSSQNGYFHRNNNAVLGVTTGPPSDGLVGSDRSSNLGFLMINGLDTDTAPVTAQNPATDTIFVFNRRGADSEFATDSRLAFYGFCKSLGASGVSSLRTLIENYLTAISGL